MKNHEQNDSAENLEKDPVWDLLEHTGKVDVSPFFARNVMREIRHQEGQKEQNGVFDWLRGVLSRRVAVAGVATACGILLFGLFQTQGPVSSAGSVAQGSQLEYLENEISASDMELASEIEAVEYLGQLMAVADPGELSDAALADLFF